MKKKNEARCLMVVDYALTPGQTLRNEFETKRCVVDALLKNQAQKKTNMIAIEKAIKIANEA